MPSKTDHDWKQTYLVIIDEDCLYFDNAVAAIENICQGYSKAAIQEQLKKLLEDGFIASGRQWIIISEVKYSQLIRKGEEW